MKRICFKSIVILLSGVLFLVFLNTGCRKDTMLMPDEGLENPFKSGYKLSYVQKEVSNSKALNGGDLIFVGGSSHQVTESKVEIHFDASKKNFQISTLRKDTKDKSYKDFDEPSIMKTVQTNSGTAFYDRSGNITSVIPNSSKEEDDYSFLLMTYPERAKLIQEKLNEGNSKSGGFNVEVLNDNSV